MNHIIWFLIVCVAVYVGIAYAVRKIEVDHERSPGEEV